MYRRESCERDPRGGGLLRPRRAFESPEWSQQSEQGALRSRDDIVEKQVDYSFALFAVATR